MRLATLVLVSFAVTVPASIAIAQPAQAGGGTFGFSVTSATLTAAGNVRLQGTISCTSGWKYRGKITMGQPAIQPITNQAKGHLDPANCTGAAQAWHATVTRTVGTMSTGSAQYSITVRTDSIVCCGSSVSLFTGSVVIT